MHTVAPLSELIGRTALLRIESLTIRVDVLDVRQCWNRVDCLIEPTDGLGQQWVSVERLAEPESRPTDRQRIGQTESPPRLPTRCYFCDRLATTTERQNGVLRQLCDRHVSSR